MHNVFLKIFFIFMFLSDASLVKQASAMKMAEKFMICLNKIVEYTLPLQCIILVLMSSENSHNYITKIITTFALFSFPVETVSASFTIFIWNNLLMVTLVGVEPLYKCYLLLYKLYNITRLDNYLSHCQIRFDPYAHSYAYLPN